jgi:pyroglutamyl-peptidase
MKKTLLITGFDPFGGATVNPSMEAVKLLPEQIGDYQLVKLEIPTVFGLGAERVLELAEKCHPDVIISVGQAGTRSAVTPERIGVNIRDAKIADNAGSIPKGQFVAEDGPAAYFSTLPVRKMAEAISSEGIASKLSYTAGAYVCNDLYYSLLHRFFGTKRRVCFIHVPYSKEQGKEPSMELCDMVRAITAAIGVI